MEKFVICFLLLIVSLPAVALGDGQVMYVGGTRADVHVRVVGSLDITSKTALIFKYTGSTLVIPYASIESVQYSQAVTRHLGVLPAIAVGLLAKRRHRHFFHIGYRDSENVAQAVIFEVPKHIPRTLQAVLQTRSPQTCKQSLPCAGHN
jgi:hypothetical protein